MDESSADTNYSKQIFWRKRSHVNNAGYIMRYMPFCFFKPAHWGNHWAVHDFLPPESAVSVISELSCITSPQAYLIRTLRIIKWHSTQARMKFILL